MKKVSRMMRRMMLLKRIPINPFLPYPRALLSGRARVLAYGI